MEFIHEPVLLQEVLEWMDVKPDGVYCDGTLGGGGHSGAMLRLSGGTATLYGIDRDMTAIEAATARLREFPGFHALHGNFHDGKALLMAAGAPKLDGVLLDLGVSSPQLDRGERGFSYHEDAPLDMRMDVSQGQTAADLLNSASEQELCRIIRDYGEESCNWIELMKCMRQAGVQIEALIEYVALFQQGDSTIGARKALLIEQRNQLLRRMQAMQESLDRLNYKIQNYERSIVPAEQRLQRASVPEQAETA